MALLEDGDVDGLGLKLVQARQLKRLLAQVKVPCVLNRDRPPSPLKVLVVFVLNVSDRRDPNTTIPLISHRIGHAP